MYKKFLTSTTFLMFCVFSLTSFAQANDPRNPPYDIHDMPQKIHLLIDINGDGNANAMLETLAPPRACQRWYSSSNLYAINPDGETFKEKYQIAMVCPDSHTLWCQGVLYATGVTGRGPESFAMDFNTHTGSGACDVIQKIEDDLYQRIKGEVIEVGNGWPGAD